MTEFETIKNRTITVRIPDTLFSHLKKAAEERGTSVGELVREQFVNQDTIDARLARIEEKLDLILGDK